MPRPDLALETIAALAWTLAAHAYAAFGWACPGILDRT